MTGDEIIALARANFGEASPNTVSVQTAKDFLNSALQELYNDLPSSRMKNLIAEDSVALTSGQGLVVNTYDQVLEVYVDSLPAIQVPREVIRNSDHNDLFTSPVPIFYVDEKNLWVRPTTGLAKIVHLDPPGVIADFTQEVSVFAELWHPALALLVTSYLYAQEEDTTQAAHYRGEYSHTLTNLMQGVQEEVSA